MRKIILTVEQDERIKLESKNGDSEYKALTLDCHINGWSAPLNQCLRSLSISDMARILYEPNCYEVEQPPFAVGDWVAYISSNRVFKIMNVQGIIVTEDKNISTISEVLRHATKEEIFWAELGREVGEFKVGDVTLTVNDSPFLLEKDGDILAEKDEYNNGRLKGIFPIESFKRFTF